MGFLDALRDAAVGIGGNFAALTEYLSLAPPKDFRKLVENEFKLSDEQFRQHIDMLKNRSSANDRDGEHAARLISAYSLSKRLVKDLLSTREFLLERTMNNYFEEYGLQYLSYVSLRLEIMAQMHEDDAEAEKFTKLANDVDKFLKNRR